MIHLSREEETNFAEQKYQENRSPGQRREGTERDTSIEYMEDTKRKNKHNRQSSSGETEGSLLVAEHFLSIRQVSYGSTAREMISGSLAQLPSENINDDLGFGETNLIRVKLSNACPNCSRNTRNVEPKNRRLMQQL